MRKGQMTFDLGEGSYCRDCIVRDACGDATTARACQPFFGEPRFGGVNVVHPDRHDFAAYFAEVGGPRFDEIRAAPVDLSPFPLMTPRVYPRRELAGHLHRPFYAVGADEAIFGRRYVLPANELREILDLWANQRLALMLYGKDEQLEGIWGRRRELVSQISEADYDFVSPPSFSVLVNHPPSEGLRNLKRSLLFFELLQEHGVPTAPRFAWLSEYDVDRAAQWCEANPDVRLLTLDLAIKHRAEWQRQIRLLWRFDQLTGQRLTFLIHGPAAESRLIELFGIMGSRLRLTGSRAISRPRSSQLDFVRFASEEEAVALRAMLQAGIGEGQHVEMDPPRLESSRGITRIGGRVEEPLAA